jgi:hypothetical protein
MRYLGVLKVVTDCLAQVHIKELGRNLTIWAEDVDTDQRHLKDVISQGHAIHPPADICPIVVVGLETPDATTPSHVRWTAAARTQTAAVISPAGLAMFGGDGSEALERLCYSRHRVHGRCAGYLHWCVNADTGRREQVFVVDTRAEEDRVARARDAAAAVDVRRRRRACFEMTATVSRNDVPLRPQRPRRAGAPQEDIGLPRPAQPRMDSQRSASTRPIRVPLRRIESTQSEQRAEPAADRQVMFTHAPDVLSPDVFYLDYYRPYWLDPERTIVNPDFDAFSGRILDIKNGHDDAVEYFHRRMEQRLGRGFPIVTVPPSNPTEGPSGIARLGQRLAANGRIDTTGCLERNRHIRSAAREGGDRRSAERTRSIEVTRTDTISGRRVLLLDDVITTGNTLSDCQRLLSAAGAASVTCAALGKTSREPAIKWGAVNCVLFDMDMTLVDRDMVGSCVWGG